ncbi:hypothetical protein P9112_006845 [Eukaryota sp. TZLM1-RC]
MQSLTTFPADKMSQIDQLQNEILSTLASISTQMSSKQSKLIPRINKTLTQFEKNRKTLINLEEQLRALSTKCFTTRQRLYHHFPEQFDFEIDDEALPSERFQFSDSEEEDYTA